MKRSILSLFFLIISWSLLSQNCLSDRYRSPVFSNVTTISGVKFATAQPYGIGGPQDLLMDIYFPSPDTLTKRPTIIFQFGGGFLIGTRGQPPIPQFCQNFAKRGYVVVTIDYRIGFNTLSTGSCERAVYRAVQDQRAAIRYLADHCNQYGIDTNWLILTGTSAGCFAGLHSTYMSQSQVPPSYQGLPLESDNLGCIDCSGNTNYGNKYIKAKAIINQWGAILDTNFITNSPEKSTPVISFHGTNDNAVPYVFGYPFSYPVFPNVYGSKPIHERLTHLGIKNQLIPLVGYGHEPELLAPNLNDTIEKYSSAFLFELLRPTPPSITPTGNACKGSQQVFTTPLRAGSSYCWQLTGPGQIISQNNNTITVAWLDTGAFSLTVKEINYQAAEGLPNQYSNSVLAPPVGGFTYVENELLVSFTDTTNNATQWQWNTGIGNWINGQQNPIVNYPEPGGYSVTLIVKDNYCNDTIQQLVQVDTCPKAQFDFVIKGDSVFFTSTPTNAVSVKWNFGDGDSVTNIFNPVHVFAQKGPQVITYQVTNGLGCTNSTIRFITLTDITDNTLLPNQIHLIQSGGKMGFLNSGSYPIAVELFDLLGQKQAELLLQPQQITGVENHLAGGFYILRSKQGQFIQRCFQP